MQVYLVGGAVRDTLLGHPIKDKDFMVVGASPADLLTQGFTQVGADFPVFLHPHTYNEYALARTERKNGKGHQGFAVQTDGVSLQDDLARRDLTINALAIEVDGLFDDTPRTGQVVDFYDGQNDLRHKLYAMYPLHLAKTRFVYCESLAFMPAFMSWVLRSP